MKKWAKFDRYDFLIYLLNSPALFIANYVIFGSAYYRDKTLFVQTTVIVNCWGASGIYRAYQLDEIHAVPLWSS